MKKVWIIVANSCEAKIYRSHGAQGIVEHAIIYHEESHLATSDLVSDRQGRETTAHRPGSDTYQPKTSPKLKEALLFAESLSELLERGHKEKEFESLYLIAKAPFLGHLHQSIPAHLQKLIASEVHKDLTHMNAEEIRKYLPEFL